MGGCNTTLYNPSLGIYCSSIDDSIIGVGSIKIFIPIEFYKTKTIKEILSKPNFYFFDANMASVDAENNIEYICIKVWRIYKSYNVLGYYKTREEADEILKSIYDIQEGVKITL